MVVLMVVFGRRSKIVDPNFTATYPLVVHVDLEKELCTRVHVGWDNNYLTQKPAS